MPRLAHNSHRWSIETNRCKGCDIEMNDSKAQQPCPTPYQPPPRRVKEHRDP